jgi:hypothetical protein
MGLSPRAARRRERLVLWHILIISCLAVVGLWGYFGALSLPGFVPASYWRRVYWTSEDEARKLEALQRLYPETDAETVRVFSPALHRKSEALSDHASWWFSRHRVRGFEDLYDGDMKRW